MDIIIDGYNLIGSDQGLRGDLERKRNWLIQQLSYYQRIKGFGVVVVFDGWQSGSVEEIKQPKEGVTVVYSRQGEKADDVIVRLARQKGSGCVVVSSDREVRNAVEKFGATAIYATEFFRILRTLDHSYKDEEADGAGDVLRKGNPRQLSKVERKRREKLKKLKS